MSVPSVAEFWPELASDALERWDAGELLWSRRLASENFGPFREHAMQILAFEIVRCVHLDRARFGSPAQVSRAEIVAVDQAVRRQHASLELPDGASVTVREFARTCWNDGWSVTVGRLRREHRMLVSRSVPIAPRP